MIFTFDGVRQLIIWHPQAISSLNPENGEVYWQVPFPIRVGLTIPAPRQQGKFLFVTSFYNGPMLLEVNGKNAEIVWKGNSDSETKTDGLHSIMPTPVRWRKLITSLALIAMVFTPTRFCFGGGWSTP